MSLEGGCASERAQRGLDAIMRPPDPGSLANPSPNLGPRPANNYFRASDAKIFALGRPSGPGGPKYLLKGGVLVSAPRTTLRPF